MKYQQGYINLDGLGTILAVGLWSFVILVLCTPFVMYNYYQDHKEEKVLIRECERNLPREQICEIVKTAKVKDGKNN